MLAFGIEVSFLKSILWVYDVKNYLAGRDVVCNISY
jgi:hypothetical protein